MEAGLVWGAVPTVGGITWALLLLSGLALALALTLAVVLALALAVTLALA